MFRRDDYASLRSIIVGPKQVVGTVQVQNHEQEHRSFTFSMLLLLCFYS